MHKHLAEGLWESFTSNLCGCSVDYSTASPVVTSGYKDQWAVWTYCLAIPPKVYCWYRYSNYYDDFG